MRESLARRPSLLAASFPTLQIHALPSSLKLPHTTLTRCPALLAGDDTPTSATTKLTAAQDKHPTWGDLGLLSGRHHVMKDGLLLTQGNNRTRTRLVPPDTWDPRNDPPSPTQLAVSPRSGHGDETDEEPLADTVAIAVLPKPQLFHKQEPVASRTRAKMRQLRDDEPAA